MRSAGGARGALEVRRALSACVYLLRFVKGVRRLCNKGLRRDGRGGGLPSHVRAELRLRIDMPRHVASRSRGTLACDENGVRSSMGWLLRHFTNDHVTLRSVPTSSEFKNEEYFTALISTV
jgi:hypothetical protein